MIEYLRDPRNVLRAIGGAATIYAVLLLLAVGIGPRTGMYRALTVLTGSMSPSIPAGSVVFVTPTTPDTLRVGDVITYQAPIADARVVTHRIVEIREPGAHPIVITKGDANDEIDPWVARITDAQVWRVRTALPLAGHAISMGRAPAVRVTTVWLLPFAVALLWIRDIWGRPRGDGAVG
jgi:signal peptidase I